MYEDLKGSSGFVSHLDDFQLVQLVPLYLRLMIPESVSSLKRDFLLLHFPPEFAHASHANAAVVDPVLMVAVAEDVDVNVLERRPLQIRVSVCPYILDKSTYPL